MNTFSRRNFLKTSVVAGAAIGLPARLWAQATGANSDIRVAVVGFGGRGGSHISAFSKMPGVRLVALCDTDSKILQRGVRSLADKNIAVEGYTDVRKLLENKDIDVISTATPNHWHSLITIWGCQAGKDVYVEKPVSHNVFEGRKSVEASRKYNRIVQAGTQSRSRRTYPEAWAWIREGHLGKIKIARGLCYKPRQSIGKVDGPQPIPANIDYDLWCGPAAQAAAHAQETPLRLALGLEHRQWRHGQPRHPRDGQVPLGARQTDCPPWSSASAGGSATWMMARPPTPRWCVHNYGDALLIFEVRGLPSKAVPGAIPGKKKAKKDGGEDLPVETMDKYRRQSIGDVIECEGGYLAGTTAFDKDDKK